MRVGCWASSTPFPSRYSGATACSSPGHDVRRGSEIASVPAHADATPAHYELAYAEAKRALDAQESVVNELRTRSGILIAAAAITT